MSQPTYLPAGHRLNELWERLTPAERYHIAALDWVDDDHSTHHMPHPRTGERTDEMSVVTEGVRLFLCGHTEPAAGGAGVTGTTP